MFRKIKNIIHGLEASFAGVVHGMPSRRIETIGVTGTDGKTTTASLIFHILKMAGKNPAMITTVGAQIGDKSYNTGLHTTTPSSFTLQKYIRRAISEKCDYLVLETTSHALDQNRVKGINFKIGVLTNITHDHLDYHKTRESYIKAKSKLFRRSAISILNMDDEAFSAVRGYAKNSKIFTYALHKKADFNIENIGVKLLGEYEFNFENFLAGISCAAILGIPAQTIELALSSFKFPAGRQEIVFDHDFQIVIDFAHTPNSFERVLPALKKAAGGRLIHVFGSAGQRDAAKRPMMGEISAEYCDIIILTSEDPRSEKIEKINTQIKMGIGDKFSFVDSNLFVDQNDKKVCLEIPDRKSAIEFAINLAKKGDTVLITGKGHEKSMNMGNGEIPWSEHEAVEAALKKLNSS